MNKHHLVLVGAALTSTVLLSSCAKEINSLIPKFKDGQQVMNAPMSAGETGVTVLDMPKKTIEDFAAKNPNVSVRVINPVHGLYEIFGSDIATIRQLVAGQNVTVEPNSYQTFENDSDQIRKKARANAKAKTAALVDQKNPIVEAIEESQHVELKDDALAFVSSCKLSNMASPVVQVADNQGRDKQQTWVYFDLSQSVTLDASGSHAKASGKPVSYQWLVTAPDDSKLQPLYSHDSKLTYTPDTTGMHTYSVVVKDAIGFCNLEMRPFYVTANDRFAPTKVFSDSNADTLDQKIFWHVFHVGANTAWQTAKGEGMLIAVIDTGVNYNHPALAPNIKVNTGEIPENQIDDDQNGFIDDVVGYDFGQDDAYPFDDFGHGSHVAGIAASQVFGAARKAKILPIKATLIGGFDIATIVGAVQYAVDSGAKVINMSFGWPDDYVLMRKAIDYAEQKGVLLVIAAGNDTADNDGKMNYPSNYTNSNILTIAATDENDKLTEYSNFGAKLVHLAAPGGTPEKQIISSYKKNPHDALFVPMMGTSMASPLVAGIAAEVWSANLKLSVSQIRQMLLDSGTPSSALTGKISSGRVVNAKAAIDLAKQATGAGLL